MNTNDFDNNRKFGVTFFDEQRIKFMGVDEEIRGECGLWSVFRYKNEYVILPHDNSGRIIDGIKTWEETITKLKTYKQT